MLNRKGQSLVLFILLLPILLGIMALVIDVGNALLEKNHMDNVVDMVYSLMEDKNMNQEEIENLLNYNLDKNENKVIIQDDKIIIQSSTYVKGIFSKMFGFSGFPIHGKYEEKMNRVE